MMLPCSPPDVCAAFLVGQENERSKRNRMRATHRDRARKLAVVLIERAPSILIPVNVGTSDELPFAHHQPIWPTATDQNELDRADRLALPRHACAQMTTTPKESVVRG